MLVPDLSIKRKKEIQNKLIKILNKEYNSPCEKFIKNLDRFNGKLRINFSHEKMLKINAKLSKNFNLKRQPEDKLKQLMNININNSNFGHAKRIIFNKFTANKLLILNNNIDYFIKDKNISAIFPILSKNETIDSKKISDELSFKNFSQKIKLKHPLKFDKEMNNIDLNIDKNNIIREYRINVKKEGKNIFNRNNHKDIEQQNKIQKTMRKLTYSLDNIKKITNSKEFSFEHPLVDYYFDIKKKNNNNKIINYKSYTNISQRNKNNNNKYQELFKQNNNNILFLNNIKKKLFTNRLLEKNEKYIKFKEFNSLSKKFNNNFKSKIVSLKKNSSYNNSINDRIMNNLNSIDLIKDLSSLSN
jgi:hypothetical protein